MTSLRENDLVRHPNRPEWGVGRITALGAGGETTIKFSRYGESTLYLEKVPWALIKLRRDKDSLIQYHKEFLAERDIPYVGIMLNTHRTTVREASCYDCSSVLDSSFDACCKACSWILCFCGACGCGHPQYGARYSKRRAALSESVKSSGSHNSQLPKANQEFSSFREALEFAKRHPGSLLRRGGAGLWLVVKEDA